MDNFTDKFIEIIKKSKYQRDVVYYYAYHIGLDCIERNVTNWKDINEVIINKWSLYGLKNIKKWAYVSLNSLSYEDIKKYYNNNKEDDNNRIKQT